MSQAFHDGSSSQSQTWQPLQLCAFPWHTFDTPDSAHEGFDAGPWKVSELGKKYRCTVHGVSGRVIEHNPAAQTDSIMYSDARQGYCRAELQPASRVSVKQEVDMCLTWQLWLNNRMECSQQAMCLLLSLNELILITWKIDTIWTDKERCCGRNHSGEKYDWESWLKPYFYPAQKF